MSSFYGGGAQAQDAPGGAAGGDLAGTYPNPTIGANAVTAVKASTGTGATNLAIGNDSRITGAEQSANKGAASGYMGLDGSSRGAQSPRLHATDHQPGGADAMAVDAAAGTGSLRTLGSGAQQAMAGNATPGGAPSGTAGGDLGGTYPNPTVNGALAHEMTLGATIGRKLLVGDALSAANQAGIINSALAAGNSYALVQATDGTTAVNAATGKILHLRNNNSTVAQVNASGLCAGNNAPAGAGFLQTRAGASSTTNAKAGGIVFEHFADAGNTTTTETDLYSDSIPASVLGTNGDKLVARFGGTFVSSATATRQLRVYFGGSVIFDSGTLTISAASSWTVDAFLIRVSATVVRYRVALAADNVTLASPVGVGELTGLTLSNANILKITGQAAGTGAATNDIVAKLGLIEWKSAA